MKKIPSGNPVCYQCLLLFLILVSFGSCKKETTTDTNKELVDKMKYVTDSVIKNTHVPGIVALVVDHKRGINWLYTAGYSDINLKTPMNGDYTFRVGSCTKTMTNTVLLQLVGERKLSLNDKLSKYFPGYPKSDSVTIRMMSNMTSRIHDFFHTVPSFFDMMKENPSRVWSPDELINIGFQAGYDSTPGAGWGYSNTNTFLLGKIIEKVTGNSLETEITNRIISPLHLTNTGFLTSGVALPGVHGRGYYFIDYVPNADYTEVFDASCYWAAGSVYSNPRDLQKYAEALVGGGLLPDSLQYKRLHEDIYEMPGISYGLGIAKWGTFYGHTGELAGFITSMYHSNDKQCTVIIYYNSLLDGVENHSDTLFKRYMDILFGQYF